MVENTKQHRSPNRSRRWLFFAPLLVVLTPLLIVLFAFGWQSGCKKVKPRRALWVLPAASFTRSLSFSPDGNLLAGGEGSYPPTVKVWDIRAGHLLKTIQTDHNASIDALAFSSDSQIIVTCGRDDGRLHLWSVQTGQLLRTLRGSKNITTSLVFSTDGSILFNVGLGGAEAWSLATGQLLYLIKQKGMCRLALTPDGKMLLSVDNRTKIRSKAYGKVSTKVYDVSTGKLRETLPEKHSHRLAAAVGALHTGTAGVLSQDGQVLVICCSGKAIDLRDVQTGRLLRQVQTQSGHHMSYALSSDAQRLAATQPYKVYLWNLSAQP